MPRARRPPGGAEPDRRLAAGRGIIRPSCLRRSAMAVSVGFIGVGNMGNPMAGNVLKNGFAVTVYDKNPRAMENLVQGGATAAASVAEVVERSEMVLTCLPARPTSGDHSRRRPHRAREARDV